MSQSLISMAKKPNFNDSKFRRNSGRHNELNSGHFQDIWRRFEQVLNTI